MGKLEIVYRFAKIEEKKEVEKFAKKFKAIADFRYTWNRWKNWSNGKYPIVAYDAKKEVIVGMHAATFLTRSNYINSYYQAVDEKYQGNRIGGGMVNYLMHIGSTHSRIKMKTPEGSMGHVFWSGFGLKPFGKKGEDLYWDEDITNVESVGGLIEWMKMRDYHSKIPDSVIKRHLKNGVSLI
jgi:hypothetical protein